MKLPPTNTTLLLCSAVMGCFVLTAYAYSAKASLTPPVITQSTDDPVYEHLRLGDQTKAVSIPACADPLIVAKALNEQRENRSTGDVYLVDFWKSLNIDPALFETCSGDCEANVSYLELDGKPGRDLVLKLTWSYNFCRFLIYEGKSNNWKFLGYIDHDFNRYQMARHRVSNFSGRPWLVVRGQAGSGTGFALYEETWYEVSDAGVRPVLNYPVEGQTYPWPAGLARKFKARETSGDQKNQNLSLTYSVNYYAYASNREQLVAVNHQIAAFRWDVKERIFTFNEAASTISAAEIFAIADIEREPEAEGEGEAVIGNTKFYSQNKQFVGGGYEVFLRHNFHALMKIARNRHHHLRDWLWQLLNDCDETKQKRQLLSVLTQPVK